MNEALRTKIVDLAVDKYCKMGDDTSIEYDAETSIGDDGVWVQAWVFISRDELKRHGIELWAPTEED